METSIASSTVKSSLSSNSQSFFTFFLGSRRSVSDVSLSLETASVNQKFPTDHFHIANPALTPVLPPLPNDKPASSRDEPLGKAEQSRTESVVGRSVDSAD